MSEVWQAVGDYLRANPIENLGALLTVLGIWLNVRENAWGWLLGLGGIACYLKVFYEARLYADVLLNVYFFALNAYGWFYWKFGNKLANRQLQIGRLSFLQTMTFVIVGAVATAILGFVLGRYTQASLPYWDSAIAAYSMLAQWLLARKKVENWPLWAAINVLAVGVYSYKGLYVTAVLYVGLLVLALKGWHEWHQKWKETDKI